jgi:hypothetical protein
MDAHVTRTATENTSTHARASAAAQAENGESLFGCYEGREAVVVEAGTDPLLAVLLATCVEQMCVSESWRFMLIP